MDTRVRISSSQLSREDVEGRKENQIEASGSNILEIMNGLVSLKYFLGIYFSIP